MKLKSNPKNKTYMLKIKKKQTENYQFAFSYHFILYYNAVAEPSNM